MGAITAVLHVGAEIIVAVGHGGEVKVEINVWL